jgi:glycosyltransferase involved in cell wall biosynthesis
VFHRLIGRSIPFSTFLHAGTDLYRDQVFLRQKLLYVDNIIVVCDFNRRFLREKFPDVFDALEPKIQVYHLGLDFAEFPHQPADRPPRRVIAVGRLEKNKGFDYLLSAAKQLIGRGFDVEIELVGDGGELRPLKALAEKLDIADKVTFRGWLRFDDVRAAMRQATVLVHPSTGIGDAVPTVIKEAMALYTPVIASDVAGIPELLDEGRCGVLVPPKDVGALARAIERLLSDEQQRTTYALAGRRYAEQTFDLARNGKWLAELLRSTNRQTCRAAS